MVLYVYVYLQWGKGENGVLGTGGSSSSSVPLLLDALDGIEVTFVFLYIFTNCSLVSCY